MLATGVPKKDKNHKNGPYKGYRHQDTMRGTLTVRGPVRVQLGFCEGAIRRPALSGFGAKPRVHSQLQHSVTYDVS